MAKKRTKPAGKKNKLSAEDALKRLKDGNRAFLGHDLVNYQTEKERAGFLANAMACSTRSSAMSSFSSWLARMSMSRASSSAATYFRSRI